MPDRRQTRPAATRRLFLQATASAPLLASAAASARTPEPEAADVARLIARDLQRYVDFGNKASGGPGDEACGAWLEDELARDGFRTERQYFSAPWFEADQAHLSCQGTQVQVWPQPIVRTTPPEGLVAPLVRVDAHGRTGGALAGAIALVELAHARWSSMFWPGVSTPVQAAFDGGAIACVIITTGPSDQIIALNTDGRTPIHDRPMALLAPRDAAPFLAAAQTGASARLTLTGQGGRRPAFNLIGKLDRGHGRWLVVSTPRSGWFTCAGERGGGIAAWLHIARWARRAALPFDLAFVCNSGHEYQYLGAEELLHAVAPRPEETAFWLHLGANLAARDWHVGVGPRRPLPGTDSQRYLVVSPDLLTAAQDLFAGLSGLEAPYSSEELSAGELSNIIAAGYSRVAGIFGVHPFHHVAEDDARCLSAPAVTETALAFQNLLAHALR